MNSNDARRIDLSQFSLEELEAIVEERRRLERAREFAESDPDARFRPVTVEPISQPIKLSAPPRKKQRSWRDRLLLLVEIAAVLGLIAIIIGSLGSLQMLNQEVVQAQRSANAVAIAKPAATPQGELPGSSFAPSTSTNELPGSSFPPDALPDALGVDIQSAPALPPPTPGPESPTRIVIPSLGIDWPIVEGDGWEELKRGVGHHSGSANPGERGNLILSGHDDVFGEVFKDLDNLSNGDALTIYAGGHAFRYIVRAKRTVAPNDLSILNPTREPAATLITCAPYRVDTQRLVVIAQLAP